MTLRLLRTVGIGSTDSQSCPDKIARNSNVSTSFPRSPGTRIVGPWVTDSIKLYRVLRTGTYYMGTWASRVLYSLIP